MRIIGGEHKGRRFHPPSKMPHTRPTTDIAKEGLFNILNNLLDFENLKTLDIFGGTGSISYELASRGITDLTIIERDRRMAEFIKSQAKALGYENIVKVFQMDVFKFLNNADQQQFDFIFAGPPYALKEIDDIPILIFEKQLLRSNGLFILEHTPRNNYETNPYFERMKNYGTTVFSFFRQ